MAPLSKIRNSQKHLVKISGKRTIDEVNQDWQNAYDPNKRQRVRGTPATFDAVEGRPRKSCLKRKQDQVRHEDGHDRPKKRVKIPKPDNPDVREIPKDGDPEFDFDLNRVFKGLHGPAFKKGSDATPRPIGQRQDFGTESKATDIPGLGRRLSRLELLPAEVLQPILRHLLGDRTLHIQLGRGWKKNDVSAKRSYAVCRDPNNRDLTRLYNGYVPYKQCHEACHGSKSPELYDSGFEGKLHLSILRVSPLLYREGSAILWTTNKFSFNKPQIFTDFVKCVDPAKSIRKLELSDEITEGVLCRHKSWNRITQQEDGLLDWGLQGRNSLILDALKSVEHLELHFHFIDYMWMVRDKSLGTNPPEYDQELHNKICSAFGDLRSLEKIRTVKTCASLRHFPVTCSCIERGGRDVSDKDEALRHLHAHRIPRVEESFNSEIRSVLGPALIRNEEELRDQRTQIFRLRTEAFERQQSLDCEYGHLEISKQNERKARFRLLANREAQMNKSPTACNHAQDAVSYKYELTYSLADDRLKKEIREWEKESKAIETLSTDAEKRQKELEKRWGKSAGKYLGLEFSRPEPEVPPEFK